MINYNEAKKLILDQIRAYNIVEIYAIPDRVSCLSVEIIDRYNLAEDIDIVNAIKQTKAVLVQNMITKWLDSDKPQLQISAMKMLADDQARANLTGVETPNVGGVTSKVPQIVVKTITKREDVIKTDNNVPATPEPTKQGRRKK